MRQDAMQSRRSRARPWVAIVLAFISVPLTFVTVAASGVVDQENDQEATASYSCGSSGASLWQSFVPGTADLAALALRLRAGGAFPDTGATIDVDVRSGDVTGPVLGSAKTMVEGPQVPGANLRVRFDFPVPIALTPGGNYVIEYHSPTPAGTPAGMVVSWFGRFDDPYPSGRAFGCDGAPIAERDYNFVTYTSGQGPAQPTAPVAPSPAPTEVPWMLPAGVCPQIADRVPRADIEHAVAEPARIAGYNQLERPGLRPGPYNRQRSHLTVRVLALPYHPIWNDLVYSASCP
jgi:hypothetical protein